MSSDIQTFVAVYCGASLLVSSLHALIAPAHWLHWSTLARYFREDDCPADSKQYRQIRQCAGALAVLLTIVLVQLVRS